MNVPKQRFVAGLHARKRITALILLAVICAGALASGVALA
jgi:hypothetical protein